MLTEADVLDTALNMIGAFDQKAFSLAMGRVERYRAENNEQLKNVWQRIANTIGALMRTGRQPGETVH